MIYTKPILQNTKNNRQLDNNNTLFVGKVLRRYQEVSSTNEVAVDTLTKSTPNEGTVISAAFQTTGKGQIGSNWESAPGMNLLQSIIFYPDFLSPSRGFLLNLAVSLAVREWAAEWLQDRVWVKWPNDIIVAGGKLAGILIQNGLRAQQIQYSVAGIGINVNQTDYHPYDPPAVSLASISGQLFALHDLEPLLFQRLEQRYLQLKSGAEQALISDYLHHLWQLECENTFRRSDGTRFRGQISGIDQHGKLLVRHAAGVEAFGLKEVKIIF